MRKEKPTGIQTQSVVSKKLRCYSGPLFLLYNIVVSGNLFCSWGDWMQNLRKTFVLCLLCLKKPANKVSRELGDQHRPSYETGINQGRKGICKVPVSAQTSKDILIVAYNLEIIMGLCPDLKILQCTCLCSDMSYILASNGLNKCCISVSCP